MDMRREDIMAAARRFQGDPRPDVNKMRVYFIQCTETKRVKIGIAQKPYLREKQLQTMSPTKVTLLFSVGGGRGLERALHEEFAASRLHGEWFEYSEALQVRMNELQAY